MAAHQKRCWSVVKPLGRKKETRKKKKGKASDPASPVKSLFKVLPRDVKLEHGPLAVGGSVIAPAVLFKESIKAVLRGVLLAAHEHH